MGSLSPEDEPLPLNTDVVIPAALTNVREWLSNQETEASITSNVGVEAIGDCPKVSEEDKVGIVAEKDGAVNIEKTTPLKAEAKDKTGKSKQSSCKESGTESFKPIAEKEKSPKIEKHLEYSKAAIETENVTVHESPNVEKPSLPPTAVKSAEQKDTEKIVEQKDAVPKNDKSDDKNTAIRLDKSFAQKDIAAKLDNTTKQKDIKTEKSTGLKDDAGKYAKSAKQVVDERKTTRPDSVDRVNVDVKRNDVNKDLKRQDDVRKGDSARERSSVECAERESDDSKSLPKSNRQPDDIQPTARIRIKKSPTPKSVSDRDSEVSIKEKTNKIEDGKELKNETKEIKENKEIKKQKEVREHKYSRETKDVKSRDSVEKTVDKEIPTIKDKEPSVDVSFKLPNKKELTETKVKKRVEPEIKTEEQAWDMLLNEPQKPIISTISQQSTFIEKTDDKPKTKKNRKMKKSQEDLQEKADEDSFVEIHAIDEKQQPYSGDLVSISTPFEDVEHMSYLSKIKKPRSPKSCTPEKRDEFERKSIDFLSSDLLETGGKFRPLKYDSSEITDIEVFSDASYSQIQREFKDTISITPKANKYSDISSSESTYSIIKEPKSSKSKSLSPYPEWRKVEKLSEVADKDVYVINTTEEEFPEIQITRGTKPRKRSPQPAERKSLEKDPVIDKPVKSWSYIAASKNDKKDIERKVENFEKNVEKKKNDYSDDEENQMSSISLQEKLFELCKRTDIMVAECDTPSELNFVEEHHAVLHDLPPLEPLDFGLDDFKLEVMRDSLLEVNEAKITSPICKINIDDILSSIKETTAKVIESSTFNLIDLEKVPTKKEKGFSVIESHKITSQEVKIYDDKPEAEVMEKSSDEDVTSPVVSTDSDKDDKKIVGASNSILPSSKQSAKSKKSRRKKK